jgi:hypothetical protein
MRRFTASRYATWAPAVTTVAGSSAIVTGVAVVTTAALHRRITAHSPTAGRAQRYSRTLRFLVSGVDVALREKRDATMTVVRAAAVQISPALYRREGAVDRVVQKIAELGRRDVQFPTFPEAVAPYYPYFSFLQSPFEIGPEHLRLIDQAVTIPSPATHAITEAARQSEMVVSIGVNERDGGTLFNAQLLFDADGSMLAVVGVVVCRQPCRMPTRRLPRVRRATFDDTYLPCECPRGMRSTGMLSARESASRGQGTFVECTDQP